MADHDPLAMCPGCGAFAVLKISGKVYSCGACGRDYLGNPEDPSYSVIQAPGSFAILPTQAVAHYGSEVIEKLLETMTPEAVRPG